jgi:hypothetical protein
VVVVANSSFARPLRPAAKYVAAFDETSPPNRSSESEYQKVQVLLDRAEIDAALGARVAVGVEPSSARGALTTRSTMPAVSPTNMWWASSVSMKRVVRASGSKPLSASASELVLAVAVGEEREHEEREPVLAWAR